MKIVIGTRGDRLKRTVSRAERLLGGGKYSENGFMKVVREIKDDIDAICQRDPAARNGTEVLLLYSGLHALLMYRAAHAVNGKGFHFLARAISQSAKFFTGIEIHPGAEIGKGLFIDHGTGVVIGETCTIGDHVKLYQGVTLGAKSFQVGEDGTLVKGIKRHPDIGNRVVIYAGATILGGDTVIGDDCVVGGNVWLTHSLPSGETITTGRQKEAR